MIRYSPVTWFLVTLASSCAGADRAEVAGRLPDSVRAQAESVHRAVVLAARESLRVRELQTPVRLMGQIVIAFYPVPSGWFPPPTAADQPLDTSATPAMERYRAIAESAGFLFTERRSRGLTIVDEANGAVYMPQEAEGQQGIVLAAPGQPLRVLLGRLPADTLIGAIVSYLRLISQRPTPKHAA